MLKELLTENRTCRSFDASRIVTREELSELVDCTRYAPSAANMQPLSYRLVTGDEVNAVQPLTKWAMMLPELRLPPEGHRPTAFIVICQDTEKYGSPEKFQRDVGICAMVISLRAAEMGLATCMIGAFDRDRLPAALKLADKILPQLIIAVGKPDEARSVAEWNGSNRYYRKDGVHYVPKRPLDEIVL